MDEQEYKQTEEPGDFAKVYRFDDFGQVVLVLANSAVSIFYQPRIPGLNPCHVHIFGESLASGRMLEARKLFEDMTSEKVHDLVESAESVILEETKDHMTANSVH